MCTVTNFDVRAEAANAVNFTNALDELDSFVCTSGLHGRGKMES